MQLLIDIKTGKYTLKEVLEMYQELDARLKVADEKSELPEKPNRHAINQLIIELTQDFLGK